MISLTLKTWTIMHNFFLHVNKRIINYAFNNTIFTLIMCSWRNEKVKKIYEFDIFFSSIERFLTFTCYLYVPLIDSLQHDQNINHDQNLQVSHILFFLETKIHKYIKIFLILNLCWPWFDNDVQYTIFLIFL